MKTGEESGELLNSFGIQQVHMMCARNSGGLITLCYKKLWEALEIFIDFKKILKIYKDF